MTTRGRCGRIAGLVALLMMILGTSVAGGWPAPGVGGPSVARADGDAGWTAVAPLPTGRSSLAAALGTDGRIDAIGGYNNGADLSTVEAYNPASNTWSTLAPMPTARQGLAAVAGPDGRIYALGGFNYALGGINKSRSLATVEAYNPASNTWTAVASMLTARADLAAVAGPDGRIYALGGFNGSYTILNTVEAYSPASNTWTAVAPMPTARQGLAAVAGPDGRIYALGGLYDSGGSLATVEAYNPASNAWTTVAPMPTARVDLAAVTGSDGRIYALGGSSTNGSAYLSTVEAYDPSSNTWTAVAPLPTGRQYLAAAIGPDSRIYALGGYNGNSLGIVETYLPPLTAAQRTATARAAQTATAAPQQTVTAAAQQTATAVAQTAAAQTSLAQTAAAQTATAAQTAAAQTAAAQTAMAQTAAAQTPAVQTAAAQTAAAQTSAARTAAVPTSVPATNVPATNVPATSMPATSMPVATQPKGSPLPTATDTSVRSGPTETAATPTAGGGSSSFPTRAATATVAPHPTTCLRPSSSHVVTGDTLTVQVCAAPRAAVNLTLQVLGPSARGGKGHSHVPPPAVLYSVAVTGHANARGRFTGRLPITYRPGRAVSARLTLRTAGHVLTTTVRLTPAHLSCQLPAVTIGGNPQAVALAPNGRVYVASGVGVSVVDPCAGRVLRAISLGGVPSAVVVAGVGGRAYAILNGSEQVHVVDLRRGRSLPSITLHAAHARQSPNLIALAFDPRARRVYVADQGNHGLWVLDATRGTVRGLLVIDGLPYAAAVDQANGRLFVASSGGSAGSAVSELDPTSGNVLRSIAVDGIPQAVAVDGSTGHVFVAVNASSVNNVSEFDTATGRVLRKVQVGAQTQAVAVDEQYRRVFVVTGNGVRVLDAASGQARGTILRGTAPQAVAVDEARGRVFVVTATGLRSLAVAALR